MSFFPSFASKSKKQKKEETEIKKTGEQEEKQQEKNGRKKKTITEKKGEKTKQKLKFAKKWETKNNNLTKMVVDHKVTHPPEGR